MASLNLQSSYLITTSCCWISFFSFSSDCVTSSKTGCVFLYLDANISASLIWSEAVKQFTLPKKLPTWRPTQLAKMTTDLTGWRRTSWLFTRVAVKLNSGLPRTNPVSKLYKGADWSRFLRIASPALSLLRHAASFAEILYKTNCWTL